VLGNAAASAASGLRLAAIISAKEIDEGRNEAGKLPARTIEEPPQKAFPPAGDEGPWLVSSSDQHSVSLRLCCRPRLD
jgi:hypothetical protein